MPTFIFWNPLLLTASSFDSSSCYAYRSLGSVLKVETTGWMRAIVHLVPLVSSLTKRERQCPPWATVTLGLELVVPGPSFYCRTGLFWEWPTLAGQPLAACRALPKPGMSHPPYHGLRLGSLATISIETWHSRVSAASLRSGLQAVGMAYAKAPR